MRLTAPAMLLTLALALTALGAPALAQGIEEPLAARIDQKAQEATADPAGFAARQTTDEQLAEDAEWTVAYACFAGHVAEEETGAPLPDPEPCAGFEDAIGIAEEEQEEADEAVAEATEAGEDVQAEAEALAEETVALVDEVVADPAGAPEALLAFLDGALRAAGRVVGAVVGALALSLVGPLLAPVWLAHHLALASDVVGGAVAAGAIDVAGVATAVVTGVSDAVGQAADSAADAAGGAFDAVSSWFDGLLGGSAKGPEPLPAPKTPDVPTPDAAGIVEDLLGQVPL